MGSRGHHIVAEAADESHSYSSVAGQLVSAAKNCR